MNDIFRIISKHRFYCKLWICSCTVVRAVVRINAGYRLHETCSTFSQKHVSSRAAPHSEMVPSGAILCEACSFYPYMSGGFSAGAPVSFPCPKKNTWALVKLMHLNLTLGV